MTSLNIHIFVFVKYLSLCIKSNPALRRDTGEAERSSSQRLITWFCCCAQRQPRQSDPNAKPSLTALTPIPCQLWLGSSFGLKEYIHFTCCEFWRRKEGSRKSVCNPRYSRMRKEWCWDEASVWSCGWGHQVQVIIRGKVLVLTGCCVPQTVIGSTSCAACFNEKLQDLDLTNFFYAHDDLSARPVAA